jgi:hypothetical protein
MLAKNTKKDALNGTSFFQSFAAGAIQKRFLNNDKFYFIIS